MSQKTQRVYMCIYAFNDNQSIMKCMGHNEVKSIGHIVHFYCLTNVEETE